MNADIPGTVNAIRADQASRGISVAELEPSQEVELEDFTDGSFKTCPTGAGASFGGTMGTLPSDADPQPVSDTCVAATKAIVTSRLADLDVTYRNSNG